MKAKKVSLLAKIVSGTLLVAGAVLKWLGIFKNCEISELCTVAATVVALFGTVDVNLALDKFTGKKDNEINE